MRGWMIWVCPECGRYTADSDACVANAALGGTTTEDQP